MDEQEIEQVNGKLRERFGDTVKVKRNDNPEYPMKLWFAEDEPEDEVVTEAKAIVKSVLGLCGWEF